MRHDSNYKSKEEIDTAYGVAVQGGISGAARWGLFAALAGTAAHVSVPQFRRITIQFKVFLQIAFMSIGSIVEADRRMVEYELVVRHRKRLERARMARAEYDRDLEAAGVQETDAELEQRIRSAELRAGKAVKRGTDLNSGGDSGAGK